MERAHALHARWDEHAKADHEVEFGRVGLSLQELKNVIKLLGEKKLISFGVLAKALETSAGLLIQVKGKQAEDLMDEIETIRTDSVLPKQTQALAGLLAEVLTLVEPKMKEEFSRSNRAQFERQTAKKAPSKEARA